MKVKIVYVIEEPYVSKKTGEAKIWKQIQYVSQDTVSTVNENRFTCGERVDTETRISNDCILKGIVAGNIYNLVYERDRFGNAVLSSIVEAE